jgi:hypothetical protein
MNQMHKLHTETSDTQRQLSFHVDFRSLLEMAAHAREESWDVPADCLIYPATYVQLQTAICMVHRPSAQAAA